MLSAVLAGTWKSHDQRPRKLREAFDEYLEWVKVNVPASLDSRRHHGNRIVEILGDIPLETLSPIHVQRLKSVRLGEGASPGTVNRMLATLKHFVGLAAREWNAIGRERALLIRENRQLKELPGRTRYLQADERERLLAHAVRWLRPLIEVALNTGMRQGEIRELRWEQIDLAQRIVTLTRTKSNRMRRIPLNDAVYEILRSLPGERAGLVFTMRRGRVISKNTVSHAFARAADAAGIDNVRFHDLRHDFASQLSMRNVSIQTISGLLGHSTVQMTMRYAHLADGTAKDAVRTLEEMNRSADAILSTVRALRQ